MKKMFFEFSRQSLQEKDFFIRKAIGWALREFSKTSPKSVKNFIEKNRENMSELTFRESSKYIPSNYFL